MSDDLPEKVRWDADFKRRVYGGVTSGIIVVIIAAVGGVVFTQAASLSTHDALWFVGLPAVVVALLVLLVAVARAVVKRARARADWQEQVSHLLLDSLAITRRMILADVIRTAEALGWTVYEDDERDLAFESPDGDASYVTEYDPVAEEVAARLHLVDPLNFPETWQSFVVRANLLGDQAQDDVRGLHAEIASLKRRIGQAALGPVVGDALGKGWSISWEDDEAIFERGGEFATVPYDQIDLDRLRALIGEPAF